MGHHYTHPSHGVYSHPSPPMPNAWEKIHHDVLHRVLHCDESLCFHSHDWLWKQGGKVLYIGVSAPEKIPPKTVCPPSGSATVLASCTGWLTLVMNQRHFIVLDRCATFFYISMSPHAKHTKLKMVCLKASKEQHKHWAMDDTVDFAKVLVKIFKKELCTDCSSIKSDTPKPHDISGSQCI